MHRWAVSALKILPYFLYEKLKRWHRRGLSVEGSTEYIQTAFVEFINQHFPDLEISVLDIGARYGMEIGGLALLRRLKRLRLVGVEPDAAEAARLESQSAKTCYSRVYPVAVWNHDGQETLHVTRHPACSSVFEPDAAVLKPYCMEPWFRVERRIAIPVVRLDSLFDSTALFDVLKIDVQGGEYEVLCGGAGLLKQATAVMLESHLIPIYKGQATFDRLHRFFMDNGFRAIRLEIVPSYDGEALEVDCMYVRDPAQIASPQDLLKRILTAILAGNVPYTEFLLRNWGRKILSTEHFNALVKVLNIQIRAPERNS